MRQRLLFSFLLTAFLLSASEALTSSSSNVLGNKALSLSPTVLRVSAPEAAAAAEEATSKGDTTAASNTPQQQQYQQQDAAAEQSLTQDLISKLRFRELHRELQARNLATTGTTGQLRTRLKKATLLPDEEEECIVNENGIEDDCVPVPALDTIMEFVDESDPQFERKELMREIAAKADVGHWKTATRKLKKLARRYGAEYEIPEEIYLQTLEACMAHRLQGARASEPSRKILEEMVEKGYEIPEQAGNYCIKNCLGETGPHATHQGFGGIDTALAMLAALEQSGTKVQVETYDKIICALAKEGSVDHAMSLLRSDVVSQTPPLSTFAAVAQAACRAAAAANPDEKKKESEKVLTLLAYCKAAGYELDTIASTQDGRSLLACGVIAAERLNNVALGLRLLKAAGNAKGVAPDRGDTMVALSSSAAQRACTLIHKRAVERAVNDGMWKLAVKALELMLVRSLKPSTWVWRSVVTCCAKAEKSKKATALLMDWIKLAERGEADKPPLTVFNTCMNACEVCNEQELTLLLLDAMKKTHNTEGNLITLNIALKRLAKLGNSRACEGIIVGMLQAGVEPSVVSYTTAIAACASSKDKQPALAYEWLRRMRSRGVKPNVLTYNTALASCLDGNLESTVLGSKMAAEMMADVEQQLVDTDIETDEYTDVVPDASTKFLARRMMEQLKANWKSGAIDKRVATETIRVPLLRLIDFQKSEAAEKARAQLAAQQKQKLADEDISTQRDEQELEYQTVTSTHRTAEV